MNSSVEVPSFTRVTIEEFAGDADLYFLRSQAGEKIIVTVGGEPKHHLYLETPVADKNARPQLCLTQYQSLLDLLEPLN